MNRKRLLTILAGATAALALQMGPAAALDLGVVEADTDDGLKVEADVELGDEDSGVKLDPKIKVGSSDGTSVEGGVKAGDAEVDAGEVTEPVTDAVDDTTDAVKEATGTGGDDAKEETSSSSETSSGSESGTTSEPTRSGSSGGDGARDVEAAGDAEPVGSDDRAPREAMQRLQGLEFDAASHAAGRPGGDVTPAFDLSGFDPDADHDEPLIAAPDTSLSREVGDEVPAPEHAAPPRADAELATASPLGDAEGAVPAGLKLLAGALVAGTGAVWHVARREVGLR